MTYITLHVVITSINLRNDVSNDADVSIATESNADTGPLLVVFSNEKRKLRSEKQELNDVIMHADAQYAEMDDADAEVGARYEMKN